MKPEIAARWVDELRSGKWGQTTGKLGDAESNSRCCLGVLCELAVQDGIITPPVPLEGNSLLNYDGEYGTRPLSVVEWAGLSDDNPHLGEYTAAGCNDNGASFSEIADLIEERAETL